MDTGIGVGVGAVTPMVTERLIEPPEPVHVSVKGVVPNSGGVEYEPLVGLNPGQFPAPADAVQAVLPVDVHEIVEAPPPVTVVGLAEIVSVGGAVGGHVIATKFEGSAG